MFDRKRFVVKERVAFVKLTDTYDLFDAETQAQIGVVKDEPSTFAKFARLLLEKRFMPTDINVYESDDESAAPVLTLHKQAALFRTTVVVSDGSGTEIARFRSKFFTLGGGFFIFDHAGRQIGEVKGNWVGWDFKLLDLSGKELGVVTKQWAGFGKELFTTADTYVVEVRDGGRDPARAAALTLAAGLAIDIVFKEQ